MKRSEVLKIIHEILCDYYESVTDGCIHDEEVEKLMGTKDFAECILFRLEQYRIAVPPPIIRPLTEAEAEMIKIKGISKIEVSEWEEE
jgi:hypothetical protein